MFNLNKKTDYGLGMMISLAKKYPKGPISLKTIAKEKKMPFKFLEKVAVSLRLAGLIEAKEGKGGGYFLTRNPKDVSIAEVVEVLDGPVSIGHCFGCPKLETCDQKDIWNEVGNKVRETIRKKTLKDLI